MGTMGENANRIRNGSVQITPSKTIELHETEFVPDNGPFMKILTGDTSRKAVLISPSTQGK